MTICDDTSQAGSLRRSRRPGRHDLEQRHLSLTLTANCGPHLRIYRITGGGSYAVRTSLAAARSTSTRAGRASTARCGS